MSQILSSGRLLPTAKRGQLRNILDVNILMRGQEEMLLRHHGKQYQLKITRRGRLILTRHEEYKDLKENKEIEQRKENSKDAQELPSK